MKRILSLFGALLFSVTVSNPGVSPHHNTYCVAASGSERTIIIRVTKSVSGKRLEFTGWYQEGETPARILIPSRSSQFGVKLQTNTLTANFRKMSGETDMSVEAIEFIGDREIGSVSATGTVVEVDVHPDGDGIRMTVRPVEGS